MTTSKCQHNLVINKSPLDRLWEWVARLVYQNRSNEDVVEVTVGPMFSGERRRTPAAVLKRELNAFVGRIRY